MSQLGSLWDFLSNLVSPDIGGSSSSGSSNADPAVDAPTVPGIFDGPSRTSDDAAKNNPLNDYLSVQYHIQLKMLPCPVGKGGGDQSDDSGPAIPSGLSDLNPETNPGPDNEKTYESLSKGGTVFARTGGAAGDTYLNITAMTVANVTAVSSANPNLAQVVEYAIEINEPAGLKFDYWWRSEAAKLGYKVTPFRVIWELEIWWSGYTQSGQWVPKIGFKNQDGDKETSIKYFCHATTIEASVKPTGTTYNMSLVPTMFAAMQKDVITTGVMEIVCKNTVNDFLAEFIRVVNSQFKANKQDHTIDVTIDPSIGQQVLVDKSDLENSDFAQFMTVDGDKIKMTIPPNQSITQLLIQSLANIPMEKIAKILDDDVAVTFTVVPDVDYSKAVPNEKYNDYTGLHFIFRIEPFYTWRFLENKGDVSPTSGLESNDKALALGKKVKSHGLVRRYYDYAWTSSNTEVLDFNAKLKLLWYVDLGSVPYQNASMAGGPQSSIASGETQAKTAHEEQQKFNQSVQGDSQKALSSVPGGGSGSATKGIPHGGSGGGIIKHGRYLPSMNAGVSKTVGNATKGTTLTFSKYQKNFERLIGADTGQLEALRVRGDPRWLINYGKYNTADKSLASSSSRWGRISALIRLNVKSPNQSDYMSGKAAREGDLSLGGYYEIVKVDSRFERGTFVQTLSGYRLFNMADG